jgi:hypothetical protein
LRTILLISLLVIGVVAGLAGGNLFANFTDTEKSTGNAFIAGVMDLEEYSHEASIWLNIAPCHWVKKEATLINTGDFAGRLTVNLKVNLWSEGDESQPEEDAEAVNGEAGMKELLDAIVVYCYANDVLDIVKDAQTWEEAVQLLIDAGVPPENIKAYGKAGDVFDKDIELDDYMTVGESSLFQLLLHLEQDNRAQGDMVGFDLLFYLIQIP